MTWQDNALKNYESARKIGEALHRRLTPKLRAKWKTNLGNNVAQLLNGETGWWRRTGRPALDELAEMLSVPVEELLGDHFSLPDALGFPEFPALPPLGPDEAPFAEALDASLVGLTVDYKRNVVGANFRKWIIAGPGSGKSLVIRYLAARAPTRYLAVSVETLEAALAMVASSSTTLVVEIERTAPNDQEVLNKLLQSTRACTILAPFDIPDRSWLGCDSRVRQTEPGWEVIEPPPFSTWRADFTRWVVQRIESVKGRETYLDTDVVQHWLDHHDPACELVSTPGDLLSLCADIDRHGGEDLPLGDRATRWLRDVGIPLIGDAAPTPWRDRLASRTYASMLDAQLRGLALDLGAGTRASWEGLVPRDTGPRRAKGDLDAPVVVAAFSHAGLLRAGERGVVPYPRWVAQGLPEGTLEGEFDANDPTDWGVLAGDESRQGLVDRAIDRLPPGAFRRLVKTVIAAFARESLGKRAALEAVFAAAGRRLHRGEEVPVAEHPVWHELLFLQLKNLEGSNLPGDQLTPYTRRDAEELVATTWAISLFIAPPTLERDPDWMLPGWSRGLRLADVPAWLPRHVWSDTGHHNPARRICELGRAVVVHLDLQELGDDIPRVLLPALLLDVERDWPLREVHLKCLHGGTWEETALLRGGHELAPPLRAALAGRIWSLVPTMPEGACVAERIEILQNARPQLSRFVLENLSPEAIESTVRKDGLHVRGLGGGSYVDKDPMLLKRLSRVVRGRALRAWTECPAVLATKWMEASALVAILDAEDLDLAIEFARISRGDTATEFASFVWRTSAPTARTKAAAAYVLDSETASRWFLSAPRAEIPYLAGLLRQPPVATWVRAWAYRRALDAGPAASMLYSLSTELLL